MHLHVFWSATRLPFWCFSGVPIKGDKIKSGSLTPAFSGAQMRAEVLCNPAFSGVPIKGNRSGRLTLTFSGAHMRAELLRNPCVLGDPHQRGQNEKWLLDGFFR